MDASYLHRGFDMLLLHYLINDFFSRKTSALGGSSFGKHSKIRKLMDTIFLLVDGISSGLVPVYILLE